MDETVIKVEGLHKNFLLPHEKLASVKNLFTNIFRLKYRTSELQHALIDINFEIKKGEFFGIVGRNGSGKSTLLKVLAGIYQPTNGSVKVEGRVVPFIELGVGFNQELTGKENVYLNGAMLGFSKKEIERMYDDIVAFAELENFMDQKLKNYSSGMQVRLAFSMATRSDADILLVDEVLAVGDADFQRKCFQYFKSLKRNNKTVVFVSHDMNAVREYCDRAILIKDSRLAAEGKAERISQAYLRLFNETDSDELISAKDDDNRWGNRHVVIEKVAYTLNDEKLVITCEVKANRNIADVVYGFRVRSEYGDELLGTNSAILKKPSLNFKAKQKATLKWEVPNIFSAGKYYLDPSLIVDDGATVCDWWNEAKQFKVEKESSTSYPVTPDIKVSAEVK